MAHDKINNKDNLMNDELTWDDLADLYEERTGGRAKIMPMNKIFQWAASQPDIEKTEDGGLVKL